MRLVLLAVLLVVGCEKKDSAKTSDRPEIKTADPGVAPAKTDPKTAPNGARTVAIEANKDGYVPDKIPGKPGEKLTLVFTRTIDAECLAQLKTPDGKLVDLPLNKAVEVPVTVPNDGEVRFACGMDMFTGVVVAQKS